MSYESERDEAIEKYIKERTRVDFSYTAFKRGADWAQARAEKRIQELEEKSEMQSQAFQSQLEITRRLKREALGLVEALERVIKAEEKLQINYSDKAKWEIVDSGAKDIAEKALADFKGEDKK